MSDFLASSIAERARILREHDADFSYWAQGYGLIRHSDQTQLHVHALATSLAGKPAAVYRLLAATDRVTSMACWLVGHMTYASHVRLDGQPLQQNDFKQDPQGHTGGSLNMVPAYAGYLAANALTGLTRGWLMGQGHCVAAVDAVNVLIRNLSPLHDTRYPWTNAGLTRLTQDFYHYRVKPDGSPESPLGSHVNAQTAGGILEGGYLGFADLQYIHMPLPGERLVAFLSDGAFEEQRGADWAARWWRASDSGLATPVMIANGRRIDQRTTMFQMGGVGWFCEHLRLNGFDPLLIDGTDPAEFVWAIIEAERRLADAGTAAESGHSRYPVALPYIVAEAPKGFGFPNAGTNRAHGTPLTQNPAHDTAARAQFNEAAARLWVESDELTTSVHALANHALSGRPMERDNPLANRHIALPAFPATAWLAPGDACSPMAALDNWLNALFIANPTLRPRVGNPDELSSNRMTQVLARLKHRVTDPEPGNHEAVNGAVITALNEEAVVCSTLANKGGINLIVSYEAFAVKMLGALRQEIIFSRHQHEAGKAPGWLSIPLIVTSHTWENGKNEQSHQDPSLCENLLGEMGDVARVLFPVDANSAVAALQSVYASHGIIATLVVPKLDMPVVLSSDDAETLTRQGAFVIRQAPAPAIELVAIGAYQLQQATLAWQRLEQHGIAATLICMQEPGRFREPRDRLEAGSTVGDSEMAALFSTQIRARIFVSHTRPAAIAGVLRRLDTGPRSTSLLGYQNHGGTLDTGGMLYANHCTWAHIVAESARLLGLDPQHLLAAAEWQAVAGTGDPYAIISEPHPRILPRP